jgi:hypothetical protein
MFNTRSNAILFLFCSVLCTAPSYTMEKESPATTIQQVKLYGSKLIARWLSPAQSFVRGAIPVTVGLGLGYFVGKSIKHEHLGAIVGGLAGATVDHYHLGGQKDKHCVARKAGNVFPLVVAGGVVYCSIGSIPTVSSYKKWESNTEISSNTSPLEQTIPLDQELVKIQNTALEAAPPLRRQDYMNNNHYFTADTLPTESARQYLSKQFITKYYTGDNGSPHSGTITFGNGTTMAVSDSALYALFGNAALARRGTIHQMNLGPH